MKLADLQQKKKEYLEEIQKNGKELLKEALSDFFIQNSIVNAIKFECYTPYFNDGDECIYSINDFRAQLNNSDTKGGDYDDGFFTPWDLSREDDYKYLDENLKKFSLSIRQVVSDNIKKLYKDIVDKDLFRIVFGDHVSVVVDRNGFDIEEYEHD